MSITEFLLISCSRIFFLVYLWGFFGLIYPLILPDLLLVFMLVVSRGISLTDTRVSQKEKYILNTSILYNV